MDDIDDSKTGASCPGWDDLAAYVAAALGPLARSAVAEHLADCARCRAALVRLEAQGSHAFARRSLEPVGQSARELGSPERETAASGPHPDPRPAGGLSLRLTPPFTLGQYRVLEKIGQGGMGSVFRAQHTRLKKEFALKVLRAEYLADPRAVVRFEREMETIGRLDHDHIVRATDAGEAQGLHFLVMELIPGIDLSRLIRSHGPLAVADSCELVRQAALGLQHAHEHRLVHRDIKPSNLVLSARGVVKILDLGLALLFRDGACSELTPTGQFMGTPDYTAPEQWLDSRTVDIRADIYSLGCTLYTLLTSRPPYARPQYPTAYQKMAAHVAEPVPSVAGLRPEIPAELVQFLERMLAKQPDGRPATPAEVVVGLEPFARGADLVALAERPLAVDVGQQPELSGAATVTEERTPSAPSSGMRPPAPVPVRLEGHRGRWALGAALVAFLLLGGMVASRFWHRTEEAPQTAPPAEESRGWQHLLANKPYKRLWLPGFNADLRHDPKQEVLRFESPERTFLALGTTEARRYKLLVGFHQQRWVGGIGVYFGGREDPETKVFHFQLLMLGPSGSNSPPFQLSRTKGRFFRDAGGTLQIPTEGFGQSLLDAPGNGEQLLSLEVGPSGLVRVAWGNHVCEPLFSDEANRTGKEVGEQGEFGVCCIASGATVQTARFLPEE